MAMKRMMRMNIINGSKARDEGRYAGDNGRGGYDRMRDARNERGWEDSDRMRRDETGRYRDYDDRDDDRYEGGGGRYAGNFRPGKDPREHETDKVVKFDEHKAKEWVAGMKNNDNTTGEHFKVDQTEPLRTAHCPTCDKYEFWAAMNMMYSDYCDVAKKMSVDRPDFYAHMAKAFLMDKDAGEDKLAKYMMYVAEK